MRWLAGLALLLWMAPGAGAISLVQEVNNNTNCSSANGTTCSMTVAATGTGNAGLLVMAANPNGVTLSNNGTAGTWSVPVGCTANTGATVSMVCMYCPSLPGGITTISGTLSVSGGAREGWFYEFAPTTGYTLAFDTAGASTSAANTSQPGVGLTLSGTNDAIVQAVYTSGGATITLGTGGSGYTLNANLSRAAAYLVNANTSASAAFWSLTASAAINMFGIAFMDVASAGCVPAMALLGVGCK